jgi:SAM-dependent methyltransferase
MTRLLVPLAMTVGIVACAAAYAQTRQTETSPEEVRERWNKTFAAGAEDLKREPSALLVSATRDRLPGAALDLGTGEGRNALFLAARGWIVTGVDISDVAVAEARRNAAARQLAFTAIVGDLDTYDFGKEQWDLITSFYMHSWHDRSPTNVPARIYDALKPGGLLVMEGFAKAEVPFGFSVDVLSKDYGRLRIVRREAVVDEAEWDKGTRRHIVRFVAERPR